MTTLIKPAWLTVIFAVLLSSSLFAQGNPTVKEVYQMGQQAFLKQDYEKALKAFEYVSKYYPRDPRVRSYIAKTKMALQEDRPKAGLETQLRAVVIPSVEFDEADLDTVLTYLSQKTAELTNGQLRPNFVYKGTPEEKSEGRITLKLNNVPVSEVIRYVGEMTRTQFRYDRFAISGIPLRMLAPGGNGTDAPAQNNDPLDPFA